MPLTKTSATPGGVFFQNSPLAVDNAWNQICEIFVEIWVKAGCDEAGGDVTGEVKPCNWGDGGHDFVIERGCNEKDPRC